MTEDDLTVIQIIKGSDSGAVYRAGLDAAQRSGLACLVCRGTENLNTHVGWVGGDSVKVHSYHLENYRLGKTIPAR